MSAHTRQDDTLARRLAAYNPGGALERDLAAVWARAQSQIVAAMAEQMVTPESALLAARMRDAHEAIGSDFTIHDIMQRIYQGPIDARWFADIEQWGDLVFAADVSLPVFVGSMTAAFSTLMQKIDTDFSDDPAFRRMACDRSMRLLAIRCEVVITRVNTLVKEEVARELLSEGAAFRDTVSGFLVSALNDSKDLRVRTVDASGSARGMLGKVSDVAAAAEQSALAMREAAQTAAGLIRAIEQARSEVEAAAAVATRAADQSAFAVEVANALSGDAQAIESILGLIRDIAGQTNLLALNATIEAARAGDAGRGFAVVAKEVKSLASQTARATDDIAAKIAAIQSASRRTLDVNGAIRDIVGEVQSSAQRIRAAMEDQAHTVTTITAAVDQTAFAADSMSGTIAAIRADTETVAADIDRLEIGFAQVDTQLAGLERTTGDFVARLAG